MLSHVRQPVQVVGAGVLGLSCAVRLAEAGYAVEVLARDLPGATTSAVAGGLWLPYRAEPAERVSAWARTTLLELRRLSHEGDPTVLLRDGVLLSRSPATPPPWGDAVAGLLELRVVRDPAPGYGWGTALEVPVVDVPRYLPALVDRLHRAGGRLVQGALQRLPTSGLVVDCTGLGARELADDDLVRPVRGQVVVLDNPGLTRWLVDEHEDDTGELTYVLPRRDDVVVGGSATEDDEDLQVRPDLARRILERACALVPELRSAAVRAHRVGLRPARSAVRLEAVPHEGGGVVHCYGHGGAGVTLSWGCADEVLASVTTLAPAT